ncbi:hypothetical protein OG900_22075 [Streptomyces sp. NBC_00433]
MGEPRNLGLAAAVAGGYVLGRGKKGQLALTAAALLAGKGLRPGGLVAGGLRKMPGVPAALKGGDADEQGEGDAEADSGSGHDGDGRHGALSRAARGAASSVTSRGITALTDAIQKRTLALGDAPADDEDEEDGSEDAGDAEDAEDADEDEDEDDADEDEPPEPPEPKRVAKKAAPTAKAKPKKRAAGAKPTPKKPTAKGPAAKKPSPAQKTTAKKSRPAKKTTPRARKER